MDIRVLTAHGFGQRVDHGLGLLHAGRVVEIDQRLAMNLSREDRELGTDVLDVETHAVLLKTSSSWVRSSSLAMRPRTSPAKASISSALASPSDTPRWRM